MRGFRVFPLIEGVREPAAEPRRRKLPQGHRNSAHRKISQAEVRAIRALRELQFPASAIAKACGVSVNYVYVLASGIRDDERELERV